MSWRRSTLSSRRVAAVILFAVMAAGVMSVAVARTAGQRPAPVSAAIGDVASDVPMASTAPRPSPSSSPPSARSEGDAPAARPAKGAAAMTDKELAAARQVAADFAAAYASYRYDESPAGAAERLTPWVTEELARQLTANTGGAAGRSALAERRQVAEAQVQTVSVQRVDGHEVDLLVVVKQKLTWAGGQETRFPSYLTRVTRGDDGWLVAALQP